MKGCQLPIISNTATTGHKLQGASLNELFVHTWFYGTNWVYVILSRVRTMNGLYFREKLQKRWTSFQIPKKYTQLINKLKNRKVVKYTDVQRKKLFLWNYES